MHVPKNFKQRKSLNQTFCVSLPRVIGIVSVCILSSLQPCNCAFADLRYGEEDSTSPSTLICAATQG